MNVFKQIYLDIDPKKKTVLRVILLFLFDQPFKLLLNLRLGIRFSKSKNPLLRFYSRILKNRQMYKWGCDISYDIKLGRNVRFAHPTGVVIGNKSIIEDNVKIWQNVTLGSHGKNGEKLYPTIKKGVKIYAGAKVIGNVIVGENSVVGANAVVNINVPSNSLAVGIPCKIILRD